MSDLLRIPLLALLLSTALGLQAQGLQAQGLEGQALNFPELTGRVVDQAELLEPATESQLSERLAAHEAATTEQLVVATLPDLQGVSIEEYSYQLVRQAKALKATRLGSALIASLPVAVGRPERTALWEQRLGAIAEQGEAPAPFLAALIEDLHGLLAAADTGRMREALHGAQGEQAPAARSPRGTRHGSPRRKAATRRTRRS